MKIRGYDIIGDIHNCSGELFALFDKLGYENKNGLKIHPDGRIPVLAGDFCDRGPNFTPIYLFIRDMWNEDLLLSVMGNHDNKLMRMCKGNNVQRTHGLDKSELAIVQAEKDNLFTRQEVKELIEQWPYFMILDNGKLIVTHAAWKKELRLKSPTSNKVKSYCLYGPVAGFHEDGMPDRIDWAAEYKSNGEIVVVGHQVVKEVQIRNNVYQIDTGCVFGNKLTALRYPEMEIVQTKSFQKWDSSEFSDKILNE
jgi:diadenosine tetraphosphatase ApaH/serine/threonine PP2A family protein phosphatase